MTLFLLFLLGFFLLWKGGSFLVNGAGIIGKAFRISPIILGATLLTFGTSAPELMISVFSGISKQPTLLIGSVLGSNIANSFLILGLCAVLIPLKVDTFSFKKELWVNVAASCLLGLLVFFPHAQGLSLSRLDGGLLILAFVGFLVFLAKTSDADLELSLSESQTHSLYKGGFFFLLGAILLPLGSYLVVHYVRYVALYLGMSQSFVALFIVAIGASFPELVTTLMAARQKKFKLAVGAIIGSNIFNLLLVMGVGNLIYPIQIPSFFSYELRLVCLSSVLLLFLLEFSKKHTISRFRGLLFLAFYGVYLAYIWMRG